MYPDDHPMIVAELNRRLDSKAMQPDNVKVCGKWVGLHQELAEKRRTPSLQRCSHVSSCMM